MFLHLSVSLFVHRGRGCLGRHPSFGQTPPRADTSPGRRPRQIPMWTDTPGQTLPGRHPPGRPPGRHPRQTPLSRHPPSRQLLQQTVCILLECILVENWYWDPQNTISLFISRLVHSLNWQVSVRKPIDSEDLKAWMEKIRCCSCN